MTYKYKKFVPADSRAMNVARDAFGKLHLVNLRLPTTGEGKHLFRFHILLLHSLSSTSLTPSSHLSMTLPSTNR